MIQNDFAIGERIRQIRKRRGLSMRALAEGAGLSANAISKIERGASSPTVSSLRGIANALNIPLVDFFQEQSSSGTIFTPRQDRQRSYLEGGVVESLGSGLPNQHLEPFLVILESGGGTISDPYHHPGEEFALCLQGEIEHRVGDRLYHLTPGDSLLFDPQQPHSFRSVSPGQSRLLVILREPSREDRLRARGVHENL
jgi:transcriptional regulator with XRE-family HTH domain